MQNIWIKVEKSSKTGKVKKSLISTFESCLNATCKVEFVQGRLGTNLCLHSNWDFPKISWFPKILSFSRSVTREATRMPKLLDYLSRLVSLVANLFLLRHCKVQKYCDQDCLKIFFFLSALPVIIRVFGKNTHWLQKCQSSQKNYQQMTMKTF